jgi:hypothetical protein
VTGRTPNPYERVRLTAPALGDLDAIRDRSLGALREVFRRLRRLDRGEITPTPLPDFAKIGDLSDCGRIVVEVEGEPEYRIVVCDVDGVHDVVEVLVVEARSDDLAYLLAGSRLGRIARIRRRLAPP